MKTWNFIDKSEWPERGEWDNEPDKAQWVDEATGLTCLAVRAHSHWCGYVGVGPDHPAYEKDYQDIDVSVHGGVTYADHCQKGMEEGPGICHLPQPGEPDSIWWIGFDCAHYGDYRPAQNQVAYEIDRKYGTLREREHYKTLDYVRRETADLAKQLKAMQI